MDLYWLKSIETPTSVVRVDHNSNDKKITLSLCLEETTMFPSGVFPTENLSPKINSFLYNNLTYYYSPETSKTFDFDTLVTSDFSFDVFQTWLITRPVYPSGQLMQPFTLRDPINLHRVTYPTKLPNLTLPYYDEVPVGFFNIPLSSSSYEDCFVMVSASDLLLFGDPFEVTEVDRTTMTDEEVRALRISKFPKINLSVVGNLTASNTVSLTAELLDVSDNLILDSVELYFENINGQLSHTRKTTVNGTATIKVAAPMLEAGDTVRVKVGVKYFSSVSDVTILVG